MEWSARRDIFNDVAEHIREMKIHQNIEIEK